MSGYKRVWGQGGPECLLLHCSLAHSGAWDGVAKALSEGYRLAAPDLIGHGRAPDLDPGQDFHDQMTAQVQGFLPGAPCHLIGHSFGATVALRLAEELPEQVRSLTLIEPVLFAAAPEEMQPAARAGSINPDDEEMLRGDYPAAARRFLANWGGGTEYDDLPPSQQRYMAARMSLIAASHDALFLDRSRLLPRLGQIAVPVLLMSGGASPPMVEAILDGLEPGLPVAARVLIPGAGHMLPITHPAEVAGAIRAFVSGL